MKRFYFSLYKQSSLLYLEDDLKNDIFHTLKQRQKMCMMALALYQPEIPQNVGAAIRLCACLGLELLIIEPCGFPWDEKKIRQSALDYMTKINLQRFSSWQSFLDFAQQRRIVLMTTKAALPYTDFTFQPGDILLAGRESSGAPDFVHARADGRIVIPMNEGLRSLNVINAVAMITGEALRQTKWSTN
jgi:tRNA (cytidine/uridine-2'-O-)-methyltransferase